MHGVIRKLDDAEYKHRTDLDRLPHVFHLFLRVITQYGINLEIAL